MTNWGSFNGIEVNYLHAYARFSLIQRDVYRRLYTATATRKSGQDLIKEVKDCEAALLDWKKCIPIELQPQPKFSAGQNFFFQCILRLHFAYHCCYAQLHQICLHAKRLIEVEMIGNVSPDSIQDIEHCISGSLTAARSAVDLLEHVDKFGISFTWYAHLCVAFLNQIKPMLTSVTGVLYTSLLLWSPRSSHISSHTQTKMPLRISVRFTRSFSF